MKEIKLTQNKQAVISDQDWPLVRPHKWYANRIGELWYARTNIRLPDGRQRNIKMHRLILGLLDSPQIEIDHRNRNGLDNRRCNLRIASRKQNMGNRKRNKNNTSGIKGVFWHKVAGAWSAKIGHAGKRIHLGLFATKQQAAIAYRDAAIREFNEFARIS